ncbi:MAG: hypothetical protein ABIA91_03235, partial [Patescibacteria group bacterium]
LEIISTLANEEKDGFTFEQILNKGAEVGLSDIELDDMIEKAKRHGEFFEISKNKFKLIT